MSSTGPEATRRQLSGRTPEVVGRLLDAAVSEVTATGYDGLTMRNVARAAGVSPATAYAYFGSKEHLLAAVFWRRLVDLPAVAHDRRRPLAERVEAVATPIALLVADEPELAAGVTTALLAHDPDVVALRRQVAGVIGDRLAGALGPGAPPEAHLGLAMALMGGLLSAGMGMQDYRAVGPMLRSLAELMSWRRRS